MLLSKDAIADVVEVLRGHDFYRPAHELVYDAILDLYGRGEPADAVTVADELTKRGELARIGGAPYLHTLISSVPTAANAGLLRADRARAGGPAPPRRGRHADRAAGLRARAAARSTTSSNAAQAEVYAVTERRTSEDYLPLGDDHRGHARRDRGDRASAAARWSASPPASPTSTELTNGLHPGQMIVVAARPAVGKSTLGLDFARSAAIKHGLTVGHLLASR